jgi:hypothetical protein
LVVYHRKAHLFLVPRMSNVDRRAANQKMLSEAESTQAKTKEAILRMQQQTAATEELGNATLDELRAQGRQMDDINSDVTAVNAKLDTAAGLQDRFDVWNGNIFGFKKRAANQEAASEIAAKAREELMNVKEVFENEKYEVLGSKWKPTGMTLCSSPTTKAPELFDPSNPVSTGSSRWEIDFTLAGIDHEGWTYGPDAAYLNKHGVGSPQPAWNSYARRRKWKQNDKSGNETIDGYTNHLPVHLFFNFFSFSSRFLGFAQDKRRDKRRSKRRLHPKPKPKRLVMSLVLTSAQ